MPIVPLPRISPTPDAPEPVLDHLRRPTIDRSPVVEGAAALARAQEQPKVPMELAAPFSALGSIGRAISETGSVFGALAIKRQEALTTKQVMNGQALMRQSELEQQDKLENTPDETQWGAVGNAHRLETRQTILENKELTPAAREQLEAQVLRWDGMQRASVQLAADRKTFGDVARGYDNDKQAAILARDEPRLRGIYAAMGGLGLIHGDEWPMWQQQYDHEGRRQDLQKKADNYDRVENFAVKLANEQGPEVAQQYLDSTNLHQIRELSPVDRQRLLGVVEATTRQARQQVADEALKGIANNLLTSEDDLGDYFAGNPHFTGDLAEHLVKALNAHDEWKEQQAQEKYGKQAFIELFPRASAYDPAKDPTRAEWVDLNAEVRARVRPQDRGPLDWILANKVNRNPGQLRPDEATKQYAYDQIQRTFAPVDGVLPWQTKKLAYKNGNVVRDEFGDPVFKLVTDPAKQQAAADAAYVVHEGITNFLDLHPKATTKEIKEEIGRLMPPAFKGAVLDDLGSRMGTPPRTNPSAPPLDALGARFGTPPQASAGPVPEDLVALMKKTEGFTAHAFGDYKQMSIGYGTRAKHAGESITEPEADARLRSELGGHAANIDAAAKAGGYRLTPSQRKALISFDFNTGQGGYLLQSAGGNLAAVKERLLQYTQAGGKVSAGLVNRRNMEAGLMEL